MYAVSENYLSAIRARTRTHRLTGTIVLTDGTEVPLGLENIESDSVEIEKSCVTGEELQFGNVILTELRIGVRTDLNRYLFFDAKIHLDYELQLSDGSWEAVPLGTFTVGEAERKKDIVSMIAYDALIALDDDYGGKALYGTPYEILTAVCEDKGMILANTEEEINALPNGEEKIQVDETSGCDTWRDCVKVVCQMLGTFAIADREGRLLICQFHKEVDSTMEMRDRFSLTASDFEVSYIGLIIKSSTATYSVYAPDAETGLEMTMTNAPAWDYGLEETLQARAENLLQELVTIRYTPCELSAVADPRFDCGDRVAFPLEDGTVAESIITKITWRMGSMDIVSTGKNPRLYGMTPKKAQVIRELQSQTVENKLIFYSFTNQNAVTAKTVGEEQQVAQVTFATTKPTSAMFIAQLPVEVACEDMVTSKTTETQTEYPVTASSEILDADGNAVTLSVLVTDKDTVKTVTHGFVDLQVEYYLDGTLVDYQLIQRFHRGKHILALFYTFDSLDGNTNFQWQVKIRVVDGSGTVTVPKRAFRATVTGQGMAGTDQWDGTLNFDDSTGRFTVSSGLSLRLASDEVETSTQVPTATGLEATIGRFRLRSGISLRGVSERLSTSEIIYKKTFDNSKWECNGRYAKLDNNSLMAVISWQYESAEQTIDSGRMTAVKAVTADLASVESVEVSEDG